MAPTTLWPDWENDRRKELSPSLQDYILIPFFTVAVLLLQSTYLRLVLVLALLPLYCARQGISILPQVFLNAYLLFSSHGRARLCESADAYRQREQEKASNQRAGTYRFSNDNVLKWDGRSSWHAERVEIEVCGIKARVVYAKPLTQTEKGKRIVMVHGNPSWGYIWRNIIPELIAAGHEAISIDWLGHGTSDKPVDPREITFELHMKTLFSVVEHFALNDFYIAAHDWGGCVALCSVPDLPVGRKCAGLFLLNTFFPPRPTDISIHYYLLYWIWFFSTGVWGPLLPDSLVLRFMAPKITTTIAEGYSWPYNQHPTKSKASLNRFAHIVPGLPDWILNQRDTRLFRMLEGLIGPQHLTSVNAQAWLADRNVDVRKWWNCGAFNGSKIQEKFQFETDSHRAFAAPERVTVLFGHDDPLLPGFKQILTDNIKVSKMILGPEEGWIAGAGHYPMEEKPELISRNIVDFLQGRQGNGT